MLDPAFEAELSKIWVFEAELTKIWVRASNAGKAGIWRDMVDTYLRANGLNPDDVTHADQLPMHLRDGLLAMGRLAFG